MVAARVTGRVFPHPIQHPRGRKFTGRQSVIPQQSMRGNSRWWPLGAGFQLSFKRRLHYYAGKTYRNFLDIPGATVTNANGTIRNAQGYIEAVPDNTPRIDYSKGVRALLTEREKTNLLPYSEDLTNWSSVAASVSANSIVSPDGTQNADKLVEDGTTAQHYINKTISFTSGVQYTFTFFAKKGERTWVRFGLGGSAFAGNQKTWFDIENGVVGTEGANIDSASIEDYGNGWFRCRVTSTATSTTSTLVYVFLATGDGNESYAGDSSSGAYTWGLQGEVGSFPSSYIPTGATAVTRTADRLQINGIDVAGVYAQDYGSCVVHMNTTTAAVQRIAVFSEGDYNGGDGWTFYTNSGNQIAAFLQTDAPSIEFNIVQGSWSGAGSEFKIGMAWAANDAAFYLDGTQVGTDASVVPPDSVDRFNINGSPTGYSPDIEQAWFYEITYWPERISNALLDEYTSPDVEPLALAHHANVTSDADTITIPGTALAGDLAILVDRHRAGAANVTPSGWDTLYDNASTNVGLVISAKKLEAADIGATVTGTNDGADRKVMIIYRPTSGTIGSFAAYDIDFEQTDGVPAADSIAVSGATLPTIVIGHAGRDGGAVNIDANSPALTLVSATDELVVGHTVYNEGDIVSDHTWSKLDDGFKNTLGSLYIEVTPA